LKQVPQQVEAATDFIWTANFRLNLGYRVQRRVFNHAPFLFVGQRAGDED
jgi:hypothetical protein